MSGTKILFLFCACSVSGLSQTYLSADFDQLAAPVGCIRNSTVPPGPSTPIPSLKLPGITISGGQLLNYQNPLQRAYNNVYATISTCAGEQPTMVIAFDGPVSGFNMVVGNNWGFGESLSIVDDTNATQNVSLGLFNNGQTVFFTHAIRTLTMTLTGLPWTPTVPSGFYIDNLSGYLNESLYFIDPVPNLMSGAGVNTDPESMATLGTLVRGVAADGQSRVLLGVPTTHVGDVVTFSLVTDEHGQSSIQDFGSVGTVDGSGGKPPSIKVASVDTSQGPMAFALYYPPADFSRGPQDDPLTSRTVVIQADPSAANVPTITKAITILRPPVVLVHDLWGDPSDWDTFTSLINDPRFFIRRASYNSVLGPQISASIPTFQSAGIGRARENSLGLAYTAPLLLNEITQVVNEFRVTNNVAAAQADLVVHGTGGDIVRALVQLPNYNAPESFGAGNVNKLITIGTPHLGTPLATALLLPQNACFREILADAGQFSFSSTTVSGATVSGGIGDIQGDGFGGGLSPALAKIQQNGNDNVPAGLIAGVATVSNFSGLSTSGMAQFIRQSCPGTPLAASLTSTGWAGVFADLSDAMVPRSSQLAGQPNRPSSTTLTGLLHSGAMEQLGLSPPSELDAATPVTAAVINLLNAQATSNAFQPLP